MKLSLLALALVFSHGVFAANYSYGELTVKNYDQMSDMVQTIIRESHKIQDDQAAVGKLKEGLVLVLSRPDADNMVSKLLPDLRHELSNFNAYEKTMAAVADDAISTIKDKKGPVRMQATAVFILENLLSQIHPEISDNADLRKIAEKIRDAKLEISHDVVRERKIRGMFKTPNPSEQAKDILASLKKT